MARIELAPGVFDDFDRIAGHLEHHGSPGGPGRIAAILGSLDVLAHSPLVGRKVPGGLRELVMGSAAQGCIALYRFMAPTDEVLLLAVRA